MKYLQTYDYYILNESFDYQLLLEDKKFSIYRTIHNRTVQKLGLNLYFVGTFQMGVTVLYPVIEALINQSNIPGIGKEEIVLLTIFCIAQILHVMNDDVQKIHVELEKKNLLHLTEKVKKSLLSIYKIFAFVARSFGKIVDVFTDVLGYVALGAPIYMVLIELIREQNLDLDTLPQKVLIFSGGVAFFSFKSMVETIIQFIKNKMNSKKQI